jgi:hypothetical protein
MQTFLPYESFVKSAESLDRQRLGKQRVEGLQILRTLSGVKDGWRNHPAVHMWRGHEWSLANYTSIVCIEWIKRGYKDTCLSKVAVMAQENRGVWGLGDPTWLGVREFHLSHQSNLVRKLPEHYGALWPEVDPNLPYFWPE